LLLTQVKRSILALVGPLANVTDANQQAELNAQLVSDLFFVTASAYDRATYQQRKLLWRTKMTVDSRGVNMFQTLRPLILASAPCFGKEMKAPVFPSSAAPRRT